MLLAASEQSKLTHQRPARKRELPWKTKILKTELPSLTVGLPVVNLRSLFHAD